eukprot:2830701-Pyramimonas_sp.AAC.1
MLFYPLYITSLLLLVLLCSSFSPLLLRSFLAPSLPAPLSQLALPPGVRAGCAMPCDRRTRLVMGQVVLVYAGCRLLLL